MADTEPEIGYFRTTSGAILDLLLPLSEAYAGQLVKAQLRRVNKDGTDYVAPADDGLSGGVVPRPSVNAPKSEWVGYAVRVGEMPLDDAEAMTKADLIDKYGKD